MDASLSNCLRASHVKGSASSVDNNEALSTHANGSFVREASVFTGFNGRGDGPLVVGNANGACG